MYKKVQNIPLNFGPQHPAAHGVLRAVLAISREIIRGIDLNIGLLHRGTEKLIENKIYLHSIPHFDRLDYVSTITQESAFCLAIEKALDYRRINPQIMRTRTGFDELTRVLNHLLAVSCQALDVGSMSHLFWAFEEREHIMGFYERLTGARMHTTLYRPTTIRRLPSKTLCRSIFKFARSCLKTVSKMDSTLTTNRIWNSRLKGIGIVPHELVSQYNLSGIMARASGAKLDRRTHHKLTYNYYRYTPILSFISTKGDSFSRFRLRMLEIVESLKIVTNVLTPGFNQIRGAKSSMESTISHFKNWSTGINLPSKLTYSDVESPKGNLGVLLVSDGSTKPVRCKIQAPSYYHLQSLPSLVIGSSIPDLVTLIGTIDIVLGEVDR